MVKKERTEEAKRRRKRYSLFCFSLYICMYEDFPGKPTERKKEET